MKPYRYIKLSPSDKLLLSSIYKTHSKHHFREKCDAILLSDAGYKVPQLAIMFNKHCDTIRDWFNLWESEGISGFEIQSGRGVKAKLDKDNAELEQFIKKKSKINP